MGFAADRRRRSIRLSGYDYAASGLFFVTLCAIHKECLFGHMQNGEVILSDRGRCVRDAWLETDRIRPRVRLDGFVIMPNHFHGIIENRDLGTACRAPTQEGFAKPVSGSLPSIIRAFKADACRRINARFNTPGNSVWQRNYYEHVIRSEGELIAFREYIRNNPSQWSSDEENPRIFR